MLEYETAPVSISYAQEHITKKKIASGRWGTYRVAPCVLYVPNSRSYLQPCPVSSHPAFASPTLPASYIIILWQIELHLRPQPYVRDHCGINAWVMGHTGMWGYSLKEIFFSCSKP